MSTNENKLRYENFSKICRLCLASYNLQPIRSRKILDLITSVMNIVVTEEDKLPQNICKKCIRHLEDISIFINICRSNIETLESVVVESIKQENCSIEVFDNEVIRNSEDEIKVEIPDNINCPIKSKCSNDKEEVDHTDVDLENGQLFLCNFCEENFSNKNEFDDHMLSHTDTKSFTCNDCGKSFTSKYTLKTHLVTHSLVRAYKCQICGKCFKRRNTLNQHNKRHKGEKPHKCDLCGKGFITVYHLNEHKITHSDVAPYECNECGKQYVHNVSLQEHLLYHNLDQDAKLAAKRKYLCSTCGKVFTSVGYLNVHSRIHTKQVPVA